MRTTFILLFALLVSLGSFKNLSAQSLLEIRLNEDYSGYRLSDFFAVMEHAHGVRFYYKKNWIDKVVLKNAGTDKTLKFVLEQALSPYDLAHIVLQQQNIILIPEHYTYFEQNNEYNFVRVVGSPMDKGKYKLNKVEGTVLFGKTTEPLPGVLIIDKKHNKQTVTDYKGRYTLFLPEGTTQLTYSFMGLESQVIEAQILSHGELNVELMEAPIAIDAVTVTADGGRNNVNRAQMGLVYMDMKSINKLPVLMGEADIIKSMTLLPGVSVAGELSSGFNVRGGNVDQNLVLLNSAPVYNAAHLFGMFSAFIPNAISSVNLHKGTQPANFGTRAASAMEIQLKAPDTSKVRGKAGLGILNSTLFLEGPVLNNRISFLLGARTTYSNWLLNKMPNMDIRNSKASFYDLLGKVDVKLSKKSNLSFFGYYSADYFNYANKTEYNYGSSMAGLNLNHYLSDQMAVRASFSFTQFNSTVGNIEFENSAHEISSGISQVNARLEWSYHLSKNSLTAGTEAIGYLLKPGTRTPVGENSEALSLSLADEKALEGAVFIQNTYKFTDKWNLSAGLRYSWYSKLGAADVFIYHQNQPLNDNTVESLKSFSQGEVIKLYQGLEPRLGLKYGLDENSSVKLGYNITRQYQHLISNTTSATPADYWKSADWNIKPLFNQQWALGYFKNLKNNSIETSVELYYKKTDNVLEYKNGAVLSMNPAIERDVIAANARAYGLELMLKKNRGNLTGWFSYTLSKSQVRTQSNFAEEVINQGNYYPGYNDRLHDLTLSANYQLSRRWTVGSNFLFSSGRPATYPEQKYSFRNTEVIYYSERNKYRLPAYHRLDLSITYEGFLNITKKVHPSFTFSVYNVYGHKNIYSVFYKKDIPSVGNNYQRYGLYQLSIIGVPIPSITINLSF
ncbi:MAG: TonB-dependent receptor [Salinivirgaceae bacterium]